MIRGEAFPMQPSVGLDGGAQDTLRQPESWRERQPIPVFVADQVVLKADEVLQGDTAIETDAQAEALSLLLNPLKSQIFDGLRKGFETSFAGQVSDREVRYWRPELGTVNIDEHRNVAVFNPVYLGPMPDSLKETLKETDLAKFKDGLRKVTPEVMPMSMKRAGEIGVPPIDPNFINLVFIEDNERIIDSLTADQRVALSRSFFAGLGSWKADIVTYSVDENAVASLNNVTMATLEGGHPAFGPEELDELGWRHKIFAATEKIDIQKVPATDKAEIPHDLWLNSPTVEGIRQSGRELGKRGLLSDSVTMDSLVSDPRLARMLQGLARFSQQGEGALFGWDPSIGKLLVSSTGQMGAMKADLKLNEVVAIEDRDGETIEMIPVAEMGEPLKPSVEGPEFGYPIWELFDTHPIFIKTAQAGYVLAEGEEDGIKVPPIRAGGHLHRGLVPQNNERVGNLETSAHEWPPVGCGVDASDEYSHFVFNKAVEMWEASGRKLEFITYPVHGHSTNYLQFYVEGRVNPANHAESLVEVLDSGQMRLTPDVVQVNEHIKPVQLTIEVTPNRGRTAGFLGRMFDKIAVGFQKAEESNRIL